VDGLIEELLPQLDPGDIIIDGGNSHYRDTERRQERLKRTGVRFVGMGISGGEKGALEGPSMMPGGDREAVEQLLPLLRAMAADDGEGGKCVAFMGPGGAGHFVKMVHNGIEYGVMQLIAETYAMLRKLGMDQTTIAGTFASWNSGDLQSYLMEITGKVLATKDPASGKFLVELIKDAARQKGTGRWTVEAALQYGVSIPVITAAVEARGISAQWKRRLQVAQSFPGEALAGAEPLEVGHVRTALAAATALTYLQGFDLLSAATTKEKWGLPMAEIARIWRGGCIIRSTMLADFQKANGANEAMQKEGKLAIVAQLTGERQRAWREVTAYAMGQGIPVPAFAASLAYYDAIRSIQLPQNLIQAQRDFFGAHGYERVDREGVFHTEWE